MTFPYPAWISEVPGATNTFLVDPDLFYPAFLKELGISQPSQYDLEVVQGCMKLDFDAWVRLSGATGQGRIIRLIRSDEGRKMRWNLNLFPVGQVAWTSLSLSERSNRIREAYSRIRG